MPSPVDPVNSPGFYTKSDIKIEIGSRKGAAREGLFTAAMYRDNVYEII